MSPDPKPWERQPGESPRSFGYFTVYRDLGPFRTVEGACNEARKRHASEGRPGKPPLLGTLKNLARPPHPVPYRGGTRMRGQDWVHRAAAWEAEMDRLRRGKRIAAFLKEDEDEGVGLNAVFARLLERVSRGPLAEDPISLNDAIARFLETVRVRRLRRGQVTELSGEVPVEPMPSEEEEEGLARILAENPEILDRFENEVAAAAMKLHGGAREVEEPRLDPVEECPPSAMERGR